MADILLTEQDDVYTVVQGVSWGNIKALAGNDTVTLLNGSNVLGGAGNDTIINKTGHNSCAAVYWDSPRAIDVNLATGVAQDGWGSTDTLVDIHNVHTSGRHGDRVIGSDLDDQTWINGFWMQGTALIDLGLGHDRVTLHGKLTDYQLQISGDGRSFSLARNGYTATVMNVETLGFWDGNQNTDLNVSNLIDFSKVGVRTLIQNNNDAWSSNAQGVTLTYSFMDVAPPYFVAAGATGFVAASAGYQAAVRNVLSRLSQETGLRFTEVADTAAAFGQLRFGANQQTSTKGIAFTANPANGDLAGDVWMDVDSLAQLTEGSEGWQALLHEIGHALGLVHPETDLAAPTVLLSRWDHNGYTLMSETQSPNGLWQSWYGVLDLQALRSLYGPGAATPSPGNNWHTLTDQQGLKLGTLSDASGHDTLDLSKLSQGAYVELVPGSFISVGVSASGGASLNNLYIDSTTLIEDVVGTAYDDVLIGNSANNRFTPGTGNDMVDGAGGFNTVQMSAVRSAYRLSVDEQTGRVLIQSVDGASGADELQNIHRVFFADCAVALDMAVTGSTVAKVLGAVFGKKAVADRTFAGIGVTLLDQGDTPESLMDKALNFRLGNDFSVQAEVKLLFENLIGRAPNAAEASYYEGLVTNGVHTFNSLAWMAANTSFNTDNIQLAGLMQTGLDYAV
ncbi:M10 family metallopeptidase [Limnohabitans sp. Rim8]|uniref:M10 family metallopeptidase n=1 Tax=Limnohabitans sp. Rim8 TaxID=1100718 RepID=UPI0025FF0878|nr:M10 family metallopeptidase [Limnohabitans sp. Rim8]